MSEPRKYLHHVESWEDLLKLPEPYEPPLPAVTADHTLDIYVPVDVLVAIAEESLANIAANRERCDTTPESRAETEALVAQREAFLEWVRACPNPHVYMAMYPQREWVLLEDEDGAPAG